MATSIRPFHDTEENERYRLLIDAITDYAIYMIDVDGFVSSWNAGARRLKGYEAAEVLGEHFSRFYTEEDQRQGQPKKTLRTAATEGRFETEGWRLRKDGSRFWAHVIVDPVRDAEGHVIGFAKVTRDLSERRRAQEALENAQHALAQTQKLESIGKLTGGIAHDFNNLLTAITGCLELLEKRLPADDARAKSLLQNALHGAARGSTLTQRMLAFARRQELKIETISLPDLIGGMIDLLDRSLGPEVVLGIDLPDNLPPVRADANQLEAAIINLAINARDAMPNGGDIRISAHTLAVGDDDLLGLPRGAYMCLSVSDHGEGMDAETLSRATEPFFTTKGVGKGTGLGLSMVHGLAEQSGGKLRIMSQPRQGTTVELILPAGKAADIPVSEPAPGLTAESVATGRHTVLIVDDDDLVLESTAAVVEDLGYVVLKADSGLAALSLLATRPDIDVIVSDQAMPGMTGVQLAQAASVLRPKVPVILASGYAELTVPTDGMRRLSKPFRRSTIADVLAGALAASQPSRVEPPPLKSTS
ncbi:MAG TPA: PAS domain S-box protein [Rudaea sp.]|jgi:PAS domain S-box-containing protein|nr:PAS domain S-box protein [Rudaea sp.]